MQKGQTNQFFSEPLSGEKWRPVVGWESLYEVSSFGRVRSIERKGVGQQPQRRYGGYLLRPTIAPNGYMTFFLQAHNRKRKRVYLHRIVLEAFVGPCPPKHECAHDDGVRANCRLNNLRWDTKKNNHADKKRHGTHICGTEIPWSRLNESQVEAIRRGGYSDGEFGRRFKVDSETVRSARLRKSWKHIP